MNSKRREKSSNVVQKEDMTVKRQDGEGLKHIIILDTSALIAGYDTSNRNLHYTVSSVQEELTRNGFKRLRLDLAKRAGKLRVLNPDCRYLKEVEVKATELGEAGSLSTVDKELLALGVQLMAEGNRPIIVSDDYSIQNVADHLDLGYRSLATMGIKRRFEWGVYCPGCRRKFDDPQEMNICPICGTELKRRPIRKRPTKG
jgi:UPF0271 protein